MNRAIRFVLMIGAIVLAGCNGWPDAPPYAESENRPENYATYAAALPEAVPEFTAEHHRYMIMPGAVNLRSARTRQVGTSGTASVFALEGDEAPYANLFARDASGDWRSVAVID